jgi:hypothetical protein
LDTEAKECSGSSLMVTCGAAGSCCAVRAGAKVEGGLVGCDTGARFTRTFFKLGSGCIAGVGTCLIC